MTHVDDSNLDMLFQPLELPCGIILQNRIVKSAMSDSLGDGRGNPTDAQIRLYERWANGGVAASIIGEVQGTPDFAEKPGNLVLRADSDRPKLEQLARRGSNKETQLWLQLGHAGAMAHPPISCPRGPSAIDIPGLRCAALTLDEVRTLPREFARTARMAQSLGFGGVQIHAAQGFLLSQFLSPLFNKRTTTPLMVTGGFKTRQQGAEAIAAGGVTAWYTMRLTEIGEDRETTDVPDLEWAIRAYTKRDASRVALWADRFEQVG